MHDKWPPDKSGLENNKNICVPILASLIQNDLTAMLVNVVPTILIKWLSNLTQYWRFLSLTIPVSQSFYLHNQSFSYPVTI